MSEPRLERPVARVELAGTHIYEHLAGIAAIPNHRGGITPQETRCVTRYPAPVCLCGAYRIEWVTTRVP